MRDDTQKLTVTSTLEEGDVYPFVRVGLVVSSGLVLIALVSTLPGLEALVGWLPVSVNALALAAATALVTAGFLAVSPSVERLVSRTLRGPDEVVDDAAASAKFLVVFVAVVVAHRGFEPAFVPITDRFALEWLYHAAFLLCALIPLVLIARRLARSLDPLAAAITRAIAGGAGTDSRAETNAEAKGK